MNKDLRIKKLENEILDLKKLVYRDELTGLYNRRGFKDEATPFLNESNSFEKFKNKRKSIVIKNFSLILFDIDNFKKINDTYGHPAGDMVIQFVSQIIEDRVRELDLVARWGGEEIIVGLPGANLDDAFKIADDIREKISKTSLKYGDKEIRLTLSGGISSSGRDKLEMLIQKADEALYEAKNSGKNKIVKSK